MSDSIKEVKTTSVEQGDVKESEVNQDVKMEQPEQTDSKSDVQVPLYRLSEEIKKRKEADAKLAKIQENELERKGEFRTLLEKEREKNAELSNYKEQFDILYEGVRGDLLEMLPEDKREKFGDVKDITLLKSIVSEFTKEIRKNVGQAESKVDTKNIKSMVGMSRKEKRENWQSILESYTR